MKSINIEGIPEQDINFLSHYVNFLRKKNKILKELTKKIRQDEKLSPTVTVWHDSKLKGPFPLNRRDIYEDV